jgi:hypothetical protein
MYRRGSQIIPTSENEFISFCYLSKGDNGIGISDTSGHDISIIKYSTEPKVIWNIIIDYNEGFDFFESK